MNNYYDSYSRLHNKPVTPYSPCPCNNPWVYTADFFKIENIHPNLQYTPELIEAGNECAEKRLRHPVAMEPAADQVPISRDEILGLEYLGFRVSMDGWKFSPKDYPIPPFSPINLLKQAYSLLTFQPYYKRVLGVDVPLVDISLKDRNYFWKNNLDQIYRFAFSVPLTDRYSILKWSGRFKWYKPSHLFYAGVSLIDRLGPASGLRWLKYGGEKNLGKMCEEFTSDHPILDKIRGC